MCAQALTKTISKQYLRAFTLVELLIAISIFSVVVLITSNLFVNALGLDRQTALQQQVFIDARFALNKIAQAIQTGTIDYEEYFNQIVLSKQIYGKEYANTYGDNYGSYAARFYNPGEVVTLRSGETVKYGTACNDSQRKWTPGHDCTLLKRTIDRDTGQNPYRAGDSYDVDDYTKVNNSACMTVDDSRLAVTVGRCDLLSQTNNIFDELYLINSDGTEKAIFVREPIKGKTQDADAFAVSFVKMKGQDINNDKIPDTFICGDEFSCRGETPSHDDKRIEDFATDTQTNGFSQDFVPISPTRITIKDLKFHIVPLENPHRAFAENDPSLQKLPHITIFVTVGPNKNIVGGSVQDFELMLEETVSTTLLEPVPTPVRGQY